MHTDILPLLRSLRAKCGNDVIPGVGARMMLFLTSTAMNGDGFGVFCHWQINQKEFRTMSKTSSMKFTKTVLASLCFLLALALCTNPAIANDFNETQRLAKHGNPDAQYKLGKMYYDGKDGQWDLKKAAEWLQKAAEQGQADAQYELGSMYHEGIGVRQNKKKAAEWFKKAAGWYKKAAVQGDAAAQFKIGLMYCRGEGVPKDMQKSGDWYRKAAVQGMPKRNIFSDTCMPRVMVCNRT